VPHPMSPRARLTATAATALLALALALGACGSNGSDPDETGPVDQAVEKLDGFGLSAGEASCVVDAVGAETVVEASDLNAFTESQQYQDAAKECIDD
jgi:hypothetical protein